MRLDKHRSLKEHLAFTWLVSSGLAILTCALTVAVVGWIDYRNTQNRLTDEIIDKSATVSRRLAAELLLGTNGASEKVAELLKAELNLSNISLSKNPDCKPKSTPTCQTRSLGVISVTTLIPHLQQETFVTISSALPPFFTKDRFYLFFLSVIPIALVLAFALGLQRYFVGKYILKPINSLVDTTTGLTEPEPLWPTEIQEISKRLATSFEERDQAIYGQMTRGIIHDIRTLLHSVLSAIDLVKEQPELSDKRSARLETLFKAAGTNLPKINSLIDLTLDAGRDVSIQSRPNNLTQTLKQSISTNQALNIAQNISIQISNIPESLLVSHDPVQLERVFTNLIKNGLEACLENKKGSTSSAVTISGSIDSNDKTVSIAIEDTGKGLSKEPNRVFRLLRSTKLHGSGLGLLVSRKIVQAHGGKLTATHSKNLGGAKFIVQLPLTSPEALA